jgi:RNA polymerase sigma-70 factor (ECF subfamily)
VSLQNLERSLERCEVETDRLELSAADVSRVYGFVAGRVANRADAADIAQQALLVACVKRDTWRGENYSAWLLAIARHLIADHYRAKKRFQFVDVTALEEKDPALHSPPASPSIHEHSERLTHWVDNVRGRLRPEEQVAVLLADVYSYRDRDSAEVLRMSVPSFKLLLHGARARLKEATGTGSMNLERRIGVTCRLGRAELLALRNRLQEGLTQLVGRILSKLWPLMGLDNAFESDLEIPWEDVSVLVQDLATTL